VHRFRKGRGYFVAVSGAVSKQAGCFDFRRFLKIDFFVKWSQL
jgi:hypothetical protein